MRCLKLSVAGVLFVGFGVEAQSGRPNQGTRIEPGQSYPPGMTEVRPRTSHGGKAS